MILFGSAFNKDPVWRPEFGELLCLARGSARVDDLYVLSVGAPVRIDALELLTSRHLVRRLKVENLLHGAKYTTFRK